jgi:hypothetical protein
VVSPFPILKANLVLSAYTVNSRKRREINDIRTQMILGLLAEITGFDKPDFHELFKTVTNKFFHLKSLDRVISPGADYHKPNLRMLAPKPLPASQTVLLSFFRGHGNTGLPISFQSTCPFSLFKSILGLNAIRLHLSLLGRSFRLPGKPKRRNSNALHLVSKRTDNARHVSRLSTT